MDVDQAIDRARQLAIGGGRRIVGIAGCPGGGKSTVVARISAELGPELCVVVPMDGFHLDNDVLVAHGTRARKGAPFTFDAGGYVSLLRRLRHQSPAETIFAPRYDRARSLSVAGAIEVPASVPLVLTEGNYLLLPDDPWAEVPRLLDATWFVEVPDEVRLPRLINRHVESGKTLEEATEWVTRSDETNAALVKASAGRATDIVTID
jgi:pantothenate kinase